MAETQPPPSSSIIPGKSGGSGPYLIGVVALGALIAGLVFWKKSSAPTTPVATAAPTVSVPPKVEPQIVHAPPPPPPIEEVADAGAEPDKGKAAAAPGTTGRSLCAKCGDGKESAALVSALRGTAQSAQGCYNRALRTSEVSGNMTVSVQVASNGSVCGASIANDTVGSGEIANCVLSRFRGKSFPPPEKGCVVVNIPISFTIRK